MNTARLYVVPTPSQHERVSLSDLSAPALTPVRPMQEASFDGSYQKPSKAAMIELAIAELKKLKVPFQRPGEYHIKVGRFNFFPTSGKITVDGVGAVQEQGLENYITALRRSGFVREA